MTAVASIQMTAGDLAEFASDDLRYPDGETVIPPDVVLTVEGDGDTLYYTADDWDDTLEFGPAGNSPELAKKLGYHKYVIRTDSFLVEVWAKYIEDAIQEAFDGEFRGVVDEATLVEKFERYVKHGAWCWIEEDGKTVLEIGKP